MKAIQKALTYDIATEGLDGQGKGKDPRRLGSCFGHAGKSFSNVAEEQKAKGMSSSGKRWTVRDRYGNSIYLTQERWEHIKKR